MGLAFLGVLTQAVAQVRTLSHVQGLGGVHCVFADFWQKTAVLCHMDLATCLPDCPWHMASASYAARGSEGRKEAAAVTFRTERHVHHTAFVTSKSPDPAPLAGQE